MVVKKTKEEINIMAEGGRILAEVLFRIGAKIMPGVSGKALDDFAESEILKAGAKPAFKGYRGYPATICFSVDDEVVHGIPDDDKLNEGQIVGVDMGLYYKGYYTDAAITFAVGKISKRAADLMAATEQALEAGINNCRAGNTIGDVASVIQETVESQGYSVVRDLVGHGVGKSIHEAPEVPNYGKKSTGPKIETGMTLALEPMVNEGSFSVLVDEDKWTVRTSDGKLSAHFEHTVAVTDDGPLILTKI